MDDHKETRTFNGLLEDARRGRTIPEEQRKVREAMARIGKTEDGRILTQYLAKSVLFASLPMDASDGAFRSLNAERRVLTRILAALNGELSDNGNDPDASHVFDRILRRAGGIGDLLRQHLRGDGRSEG